MSYFEEVILPSVGIPKKISYNISEAARILDCNKRTLRSMAERGEIFVTKHRRVFAKEFIIFFGKKAWPKDS